MPVAQGQQAVRLPGPAPPQVACLKGLNDFLEQNGGPYIGGASPCATDCAVMPRLYHMKARRRAAHKDTQPCLAAHPRIVHAN